MAAASGATRLAKLAVKYGPHAVAAAKVGAPAARAALATQQRRLLGRRQAFDKARTVVDGSVLRQRDGQEVVWVVYTGDEPLAVYPEVTTPISELVARADLSKRMTPEEHDAARARERARRTASRAAGRVRPRRRRSTD